MILIGQLATEIPLRWTAKKIRRVNSLSFVDRGFSPSKGGRVPRTITSARGMRKFKKKQQIEFIYEVSSVARAFMHE